MQALAAVLGGTQSLHTNSMDETLALPTEGSVKLALRTQQIIAQESGVTNSVDPLGGSYFVETLTNRLEEAALDYFRQLDDMGGMVRAIERGFPSVKSSTPRNGTNANWSGKNGSSSASMSTWNRRNVRSLFSR